MKGRQARKEGQKEGNYITAVQPKMPVTLGARETYKVKCSKCLLLAALKPDRCIVHCFLCPLPETRHRNWNFG